MDSTAPNSCPYTIHNARTEFVKLDLSHLCVEGVLVSSAHAQRKAHLHDRHTGCWYVATHHVRATA